MTEEEMELVLLEWMRAQGGVVTDEQFDSLTAVLEEHFLSPETATLEKVREVLGLKRGSNV